MEFWRAVLILATAFMFLPPFLWPYLLFGPDPVRPLANWAGVFMVIVISLIYSRRR